MKKTLFIAAIACIAMGNTMAKEQLTPQHICDGVDNYATVPGIYVYTDLDITSSTGFLGAPGTSFEDATISGGTNIGTFNGAGSLDIHGSGVKVTTPNNIYIGGAGYWGDSNSDFRKKYEFPAGYNKGNNGTVTVRDGATLSVGEFQENWYGAQTLVGTSSYASKGTLIVDNATVNANARIAVGGGKSEGEMVLRNNSTLNVCYGPNLSTDLGATSFYLALDKGSKSTVTVESGSQVFVQGTSSADFAIIGWGGKAEMTVDGKGSGVEFGSDYTILGYDASGHGDLSITNGGKLKASGTLYVGNAGSGVLYIDSASEADLNRLVVNCGTTINAGTITTTELKLDEAGTKLVNSGTITITGGNDLALANGSELQTGILAVSGREEPVSDGTDKELTHSYSTGLVFSNGGKVAVADGAKVTVGGLIEGQGATQHLTAADYELLEQDVLTGLGLTGNGNVTVSNRIGKLIAVQYTTDDIHEGGDKQVSVSGGTAEVDRGANETLTGVLGSFKNEVTETKGNICLDEAATGSSVKWGGDELKTAADETTIITKDSSVTLNRDSGSSKLVVVEGSTLDNQGTVTGAVQVDGTMKGTGTVEGAVTVKKGGALVIGNSPGVAQMESLDLNGELILSISDVAGAAVTGNEGWTGNGYSQLQLDGALTIGDDAKFIIQLGGNLFQDGVMSREIDLDLAIITGITDLTYTGNTGVDVLALLADEDHTKFILSTVNEPGSITADPAYVGFSTSDIHYELKDGTLYLKGKLTVPEPATATLSLLALAGLCARRRRKNA